MIQYYHVQIATRGMIPHIFKRGPITDIMLDINMIERLINAGVVVYDINGQPFNIESKVFEIKSETVESRLADAEHMQHIEDLNATFDYDIPMDGARAPSFSPNPTPKIVNSPDITQIVPVDPVFTPTETPYIVEPTDAVSNRDLDVDPAAEEDDPKSNTTESPNNIGADASGLSKNQLKKLRREAAIAKTGSTEPITTSLKP